MASCARVLKEESDKPVDFPTSSDSTSCYTLPSPTMESGARKVPVYIRDECRKPSLLANTQLPVVPPKPGTFAEAACSAADKKRSDTLPEVGKAVNPRETANNEASSRHLSLQLLQGKPENLQKVRTTSAPLWLPSNNTRSCERPTTSFPEASLHTTPTSSQRAVKTAATLTSHEKEAASGTTPPRSYLAPTTIPKNAPACDTLGDQTTVESLRRMINQLQFSHSQLELRVNNMEHTLSAVAFGLEKLQSYPIAERKHDAFYPNHQRKSGAVNARLSASLAEENNKKLLSTLSIEEVLTVLDYLNLNQYKDSFLTEGIDGAVFAHLDDEMLMQDLGIQCKLHRLKLLQVISGKMSVMQLASSGNH